MPASVRKYGIILLLFFLVGCGRSVIIFHSLDERDANDIIVYLDNKGIKAYKSQSVEAGGGGGGQGVVLWDIGVGTKDEKYAIALLRAAGLPRLSGQNLLGIFQQKGFVPSEMEEKIRYQAGLAEQIANTIRKIDGILDTDVQLSFPEEDPLNPDKPKGLVKAAVYVKHTGILDEPNSQLITKIRRLVASSVQGLDFDNVTVIADKARYADISAHEAIQTREKEKDFVRVWSLVIAKESATRFQILFLFFLVLIVLFGGGLAWLVWKTHHILLARGGFKTLLDYHPYPSTPVEDKESETSEQKEGEEEEEEEEDEEEGVT